MPDQPAGLDDQAGSNLPHYRAVQLAFAAHIRNPSEHPKPADVEDRRMAIYRDLFFNNVLNFLSNNFPIAQSLFDEQRWRAIVRDYFHRHAAESPYFLEIPQEFLTWLGEEPSPEGEVLPPFFLELCHYEWVELALDVSLDELPGAPPDGDAGLPEQLTVSPLAWPLTYRYPVHEIGPRFQPEQPPAAPTFLVVYRDRDDKVRFMGSNVATHRLIELTAGGASVEETIAVLCSELDSQPPEQIRSNAEQTIEALVRREVLLPNV